VVPSVKIWTFQINSKRVLWWRHVTLTSSQYFALSLQNKVKALSFNTLLSNTPSWVTIIEQDVVIFRLSKKKCYLHLPELSTLSNSHLSVRSRNVSLVDNGRCYSSVLLCSVHKLDKEGSSEQRRRAPGRCYTDRYKDADVLHYIYLFFQPTRNEVKTEAVPSSVQLYLSYRMCSQSVSKAYSHLANYPKQVLYI
jgi:hypothetical protein